MAVDQLGDGVELVDLGTHRLKDLGRPEHVYQVLDPDLPAEFPALRSVDATPNNLPVQLSIFIGRHDEIATVANLVHRNRLVTITGSGGAGKTRLAQQVAAEVLEEFPDGAWWADLAPIADAADLPKALASAMGITDEGAGDPVERLARRLLAGRLLLVLDNCEHLVEAVAEITHRLLTGCPGLRIVATSRGTLDVPGEVTWRIPSLALPERNHHPQVAVLSQYDAVRLFVDRAQRARPNFRIDDANGRVVAEICHQLDGIPLALELAAARCRTFSPDQILAALGDAFGLLTRGARTLVPRQRTLEASIQWSHALLTAEEQVVLRRLGVFVVGFTLDAAEAVVPAAGFDQRLVLDSLDQLVEQSLVQVHDAGPDSRYHLLETVRQYASQRLDDAAETESIRARHAAYFTDRAIDLGQRVVGPDAGPAVAAFSADHDNLRLALDTVSASDGWETVGQVVGLVYVYWIVASLTFPT